MRLKFEIAGRKDVESIMTGAGNGHSSLQRVHPPLITEMAA